MTGQTNVLELLQGIMLEQFEIEPDCVTPDARLYEDLEIDSIDAVDMVVELRRITSKQIDPDAFKAVRTVSDVVAAVEVILQDE